MKPCSIFFAACFILMGCNNQIKTTATTTDSLQYPFKPAYSNNWQPGDGKNAVIVLNVLKKYLANDIKGATAYFADTSEFIADKFYLKVVATAWHPLSPVCAALL